MRRKIMVAACAFAAAVALAAGAKTVDFPIPDAVRSWDIPERATNGVKAVWIENVPWHGKPTRFFAYYSLPEGATVEKKVPGIVLVHGGYGTAFHTWVKLWNDRGYAAIAMDNCGGIPGEKAHTAEHPRHEWSGPNGWGRYEEEALPPEEQWVYHAIECVIRSHTFLRNLPEVDASKIGVTGISWGGFLTSIACGADQRFAFAVPVYGCGNLRRHSVFAPEIGELWESLWNPVEYAKNCRIPTLWCTGTNDYFFPLDSFEETAFAAGNPLFSIKLRMKHGHPPDGDPPEIAAFADSVVKGGRKLADRKIARREWLYTESANPVWKDRPFEVSAEAPQNWTIRFENAITEDGLILSSPPEFQTAMLDAKGVVVNGATIRETEPCLSSAWLYPQMDMELFRVHQMRDDVRRAGLYAYHPGVLPPLRDKAEFRRVCAEDDPLPEAFRRISETHYDSAEGRRYVTVDGGLMGGGAIRSAETNWEARVFDGSWRPVAAYPDAPVPPHRERLPVDRSFSGLVATNGWYDALAEQFAYVECRANAEPRLFVGESIPEMLAEKPEDFEYDATMDEVSDGCWRTRHALAFRYLRFASDVTNVKVVPVGRRRPVKGRIVTDNARWRKMVEVGERTLALCSNDFLVDGIKRDRLPWGGDLTVSLMADAYVYGDAEIARRTLSVMDAYEGDVNGIVTYSMWTVVSHDLYQLYFGDAQFLRDRWWRIKARVNDLMSRTDETGFVVRGLDWVFVDWAKPKSDTALQMIWYGSLQAAARLADRVGDPQADDYRALAAKIRESLNRLAWDEPRGLYRADPTDAAVFGRQANIFAVVFGVADDRQSVRIGDELAQDRLPPVGTPYVFGWEMVALARTGHAGAFFSGLERIFGGMLDNGATTYWESYDPKETGDERYAFYGRPWAKSLCHVWSAWPAFIFVSEGLGIRPTADGWRAWSYRPLPGCVNLKAEIPTPNGILRIAGLTNAAGAEIRQAEPVSAPVPAVEKARERPVPRPAMAERLATDVDVIGIVHWGLNTYTDREWGYGDEDPAMLNPAKFDADQIVAACKAGGLKGLVVVAKHHDGFCLWPTKTTEHNITKTPFWRGQESGVSAQGSGVRGQRRDYVKEMEQACRRAGLKFGVYCSPWDRNSAHYATDKYVEIYHAQLKELLGGAYGDIFEMWFDGANGGDGYYGGAREKRKIGADYYRFGEVFKFVRELQPNVTIFSGAHDDSDIRWCGNERGYVCDDSRATVVRTGGFCDGKYGNPDYVPTRNEGSPNGEFFRVNEADFPLRRGWFYHEGERGTTKSGAYLARLYVGTVGNGGTMDIGVAPNKDGVLDADDVKALKDFGILRRALFANEVKDGGKFNIVVMREDLSHGELVDEWEFVADGKAILRGKSIGNKRIRLLKEPVAAKGCEVRVLCGVGAPKVSYALYCADQAVIDAILNAKGDDGETDTAKWMTKGVSAKREFFVSPAGNDASDGSAAHPWRTISHAAAVAEAGDTVTIHAGVYREWVKPANAGREGAPITYRAAKGERVVVTGADEVRGWTRRSDGLWEAHVSYDSFGGVNPFTDFIEGSWFLPKDANHFRTRLIQCGKPLNLVGEEILAPPDHGVPHLARGTAALIPGRVSGMIVAAFAHDPNVEVPELVVRPCCFYPTTTRRDYITLRGIVFRDAAPTWAHPRGEQPGVVGTNWSRGWMIEDCEISGSCCAGLTLGKCANDFDSFWYDPKQSFSLWGKRMSERDLSEVGRHTVRRCRISDCGQAGICGGFGAVWSTIEDCDISRCYWNKKFAGYEMAGIKIHVAVGMTIRRNRIHDNGCFGVWLDWMGQGTRLAQNSLWANAQTDLYLEVVHGPILLEGNDFLSKQAIHFKGSNNIALVGNRIFGLLACDDDKSLGYRKTPVFYPHSTRIKELYADCMPVNLVFINNIMPETPHFADLAADPCRREDNWLVPRTCWKVDEADGNCTIEPTADSPRPDFKPVTAERLGTGFFTGEEFPLPDTDLSTPKRGMKI